MWETRVQSLGQEDPLKKEMTTHSSILAWKILWREEWAAVHGVAKEFDTTVTEEQQQYFKCLSVTIAHALVAMLGHFSCVCLFATLWTVGSSVLGILQGRVLEWVAISSSPPRD